MTSSQDTIRRGSVGTRMRSSPRAVETNGIGNVSDYHLNLTRSLADVRRARKRHKPEPAPMGRPPGPPEAAKTPYAGSSSRLLPSTRFMRLRAADGRWLHLSGEGLTLVKADSWIGTAPQLFKLREQHPDLNSMTVSAP